MEMQALRIRVTFDDSSLLSPAQRSDGLHHSWLLIQPDQLPKISDLSTLLLHHFNLLPSCPNSILLSMEGFVLPPSESIQILKDKDIICVKRKGEEVEGGNNGMLLLANEEFDKETGGYQSEYDDAEVEKLETSSKKRKASTKLRSSNRKTNHVVALIAERQRGTYTNRAISIAECYVAYVQDLMQNHYRAGCFTGKWKQPLYSHGVEVRLKKKHRLAVTDGVEHKAPAEDNETNDDEGLPNKIINKEKSGGTGTIIVKVKSPSKVKRKKKHRRGVFFGDEDDVNKGESILNEKISKKKTKPKEEIKKENAETSDKNIEGVEDVSSAPDGGKKVPSRSARRKKAKRQWRREVAKRAQNPNTHVEPGISKAENKEATGGPLMQDQVLVEVKQENIIEEGRNHNDNGVTKLVPCVVRPGHIRFEPIDEDEDTKQSEVPDVAFQWNGIISKKKGQKWGLEKFSTSKMDYPQKANEEPSAMLTVDAQVPLIDPISFDQLPLCSSPKEGDLIAYRVLELSSSWTPELSSFRVGKISVYDGDNIVLMPVPEYPIVLDKMDENGPDNSLYKEDGCLEIKFAALADVRSVKQSNSDAVTTVSNGVNQTAQVNEKTAASNLISKSNEKENLSKDPSPAQPLVGSKEGNMWSEIEELLSAKKSELLESTEEMKKDSGWNKWSYRALRGSALGPTISLLRSENNS